MGLKLVILVLLGVLSINFDFCTGSCLCHVVPNFSCPPPPNCCESGMYSYDECGCCLVCAKSELRTCGGGQNKHEGQCAKGLACLKTCTSCRTLGADSEPCVFPFTYEGVKYDKCTSTHAAEGAVWCATQVYTNGSVIEGRWGDCTDGCAGARLECNEQRFEILEGLCVNPAVPGAIPNWFGAPAYKLLPPTQDLFKAPLCDHSQRKQRLYENTCRCAQGEDALEIAADGSIRGNCTGVDTNLGDEIDPVWCFLENVRDHNNPRSGCFSDMTWSSRDGRFWSSTACKGLPPISDEGIDELPEAPLHLLGRNHPLVKEAERIPFKQPDFEDPFSIYYNSEDLAADDYLLYNYDYVDEPEHGLQKVHSNALPIINHRNRGGKNNGGDSAGFLPTPLPPIVLSVTSVPTTPATPRSRPATRKSTTFQADPLPVTTPSITTTTTTTTTTTPPPTTTTTTTTTRSTTTTMSTTTTISSSTITSAVRRSTTAAISSKDAEIETSSTTVVVENKSVAASPQVAPTILPASTSKWKEVADARSSILMVKPTNSVTATHTAASQQHQPKVEANEIIEEMAKDGSKLLVVQALQRAAKNFDEMTDDTLADSSLQEEMEMDGANEEGRHVDLGIFGNYWLASKPRRIRKTLTSTRPTVEPVFRKENYLHKFPELRH